MSEHQHHHHHHHRHEDDSEMIQRRSLNAIRYRKLAAKWGFRFLLLVAAIMAIAVVVVYTLR
jgi:hypothetical protein